jgi:hypothetical protein
MDFYWTFYDTFATRELPFFSSSSPNISFPWPPTSYYPYFYSTTAQQQIYNGESVQVYSCWNGVVIMNAEPFVKHDVKFRSLIPQDREIPFEASECCLVYSDFRKFGYDKVFINPNVRVCITVKCFLSVIYSILIINLTTFYLGFLCLPLLHLVQLLSFAYQSTFFRIFQPSDTAVIILLCWDADARVNKRCGEIQYNGIG